MAEDITSKIEQANARLKTAKIRVRIQQMGESLYLQATLPPKPGSNKDKPHQNKIALGLAAHSRGVQLAEKEAKIVAAKLDEGVFDWKDYLKIEPIDPEVEPIASLATRYETAYFAQRGRSPKTESTWYNEYLAVIRHLPPNEPLTHDLIVQFVQGTVPNSRQRKRYTMVLSSMAKFAENPIDLKVYRGNYSPTKVAPRDIPSDELITEWFYKLSHPGWRWIYAMCAAFGLRPHECWHVEFLENGRCTIGDDTKTGAREVWAFYPEWFTEFDLTNKILPPITYKNNQQIGMKACRYFADRKLPFNLYDLRHGWAIRTIDFGLPDTLAAQQMGHSVAIHTALYHRWITAKTHQRFYDRLTEGENRPMPPKPSLSPKSDQSEAF